MNKKIISLLIAITMVCMSLSGCGDSPPQVQTETATEQTTVTTPTDLTEEEMEIWESMPEIVTMRVDYSISKNTAQVMYIQKDGIMTGFTVSENDFFENFDKNNEIVWAKEKFKDHSKTEKSGVVDIHKVIELYKHLVLLDENSKYTERKLSFDNLQHESTHNFRIYGNRKDTQNAEEIVLISQGDGIRQYVKNDSIGEELFMMYMEMDEFIPLILLEQAEN